MLVIFYSFLFLIYLNSKASSPEFIIFSLWTGVLTFNNFFDIYDLSNYLIVIVLINLVVFSFFSKLAYIVIKPIKISPETSIDYIGQILILVIFICGALYFSYSYFVIEIDSFNLLSNPFLAIRQKLLVAFDENATPLSVTIAANFGVILVYLVFSSNIKHVYKFFLTLLAIIAMFMPMSKGYLIMGICQVLSILLLKEKIKKLNILIIISLGFIIITLSAVFRDNINLYEYFKIYIFSGLPALDLILNGKFEFSYPILYRETIIYIGNIFGYTFNHSLQDNFVLVPEYTNIFTLFGPVISDYGISFSFIYSSIIGFLSGSIFKYAVFRNYYAKFLYGFILFSIFTSCFSDGFALLFTYLKYAITFFILKNISITRKF